MDMNLGALVAHLKLDSSTWLPGISAANSGIDKLANKVGWFGAKMSVVLTTPLTLFGRKAVKEFGAFDEAITKSMAVMEGATDAMRKDLESVALSLSTRVATSATNLAGGFFELGQAGLTAKQSIQALPIAEKFAFAGTMGLSQAVSYLTKSQRSLGMEMKDPLENMQQMQRVADNLTYAAIESTAEMIDFSEAMKNAGPALRILNKDIEEGTAALMALANQGHVGSEAGSQLYMVYRDLQRANIRNREIWEQMNLSVYDSAGEMLNLADIIEQLEKKFKGMSDEGIRTILMMLGFQDRSLRATQALFGLSGRMREFESELRKAGGMTDRVAGTMLKSFNAQLAILGNKLFIIRRDIGEILAKQIQALGTLVDKLVSVWKNLDPPMKEFIVKTVEIIALIGPAALAFAGLLKVIETLLAPLHLLLAPVKGLIQIFGFLASPIGIVTTLLGGIVTVISVTLLPALAHLGLSSKELAADFKRGFGSIADVIRTLSEKVRNWSETDSKMLVYQIKLAGIEIERMKDKFVAFVDYLRNDFTGGTALVWQVFLNGMEVAGKAAVALSIRVGHGIWNELKNAMSGHSYETPEVIERARQRYLKEFPVTYLDEKYRADFYKGEYPGPLAEKTTFPTYEMRMRGQGEGLFTIPKQPLPIQHPETLQRFIKEEAEIERQKVVEGYFEGYFDQVSGFIKEAKSKTEEDVKSLLSFNDLSVGLQNGLEKADQKAAVKVSEMNRQIIQNAFDDALIQIEAAEEAMKKFEQERNRMIAETVEKFAYPDIGRTDMSGEGWIKEGMEWKPLQPIVDFDIEELERISDQAREIVNSLYAGLDQSSLTYWDHQQERMDREIGLWKKWAFIIAERTGLGLDKVNELIVEYEKYQKKALDRSQIEKAFDTMDTLYSGLHRKAKDYFEYEEQKLKYQMQLMEESAELTAKKLGLEIEQVEALIDAYEREQEILLEIQRLKASDDFFGGFAASIMEANENLTTLGELGYEVGNTLREGIVDALADAVFEANTLEEALRSVARAAARQMFEWGTNQLITIGANAAINAFNPGAGAGSWAGGGSPLGQTAEPGLTYYPTLHAGGIVGQEYTSMRFISADVFKNAIRAHTGIGPDERHVIVRNDEGVFTPGQMKAMGGGRRDNEIVSLLQQLVNKPTKINMSLVDNRKQALQDLNTREGRRVIMDINRRHKTVRGK